MKKTLRRAHAGFTMVELLVVLMIIGVMAAVAMPAFLKTMRNYEMRAGCDELVSQIQATRRRAVSKNVNLGVLWAVTNYNGAQQSGSVIEDDMRPGIAPDWSTIGGEANGVGWTAMITGGPNPNDPYREQWTFGPSSGPLGDTMGALRPMRRRVNLIDPTQCAGRAGFAVAGANAWGLRFNRFGGFCAPGVDAGCVPPPNAPTALFINVNAGTANMCMQDARTGLKKLITVKGGRIKVEEGYF